MQLSKRNQAIKLQARPAELTVEQNAQRMGRNLAVQTRDEMPEVTGAVALDLKALAQLANDRFHQTARSGVLPSQYLGLPGPP